MRPTPPQPTPRPLDIELVQPTVLTKLSDGTSWYLPVSWFGWCNPEIEES